MKTNNVRALLVPLLLAAVLLITTGATATSGVICWIHGLPWYCPPGEPGEPDPTGEPPDITETPEPGEAVALVQRSSGSGGVNSIRAWGVPDLPFYTWTLDGSPIIGEDGAPLASGPEYRVIAGIPRTMTALVLGDDFDPADVLDRLAVYGPDGEAVPVIWFGFNDEYYETTGQGARYVVPTPAPSD